MKRLYYLTSSIDCAERVSKELHEKGVTDWNFHIMSKKYDNWNNLKKRGLHLASFYFHQHDGKRIAERGAIVGALAGLCAIAGFLLASPEIASEFRAWSLVSLAFTTAILIAFGVGFGMIYGLDSENVKIRRFHDQLEEGQYLIMIDTIKEDADRIRDIMADQPGITVAGEGHSQVNPFQMAS
ncbi:hypothetical protein DV711_16605 [Motiliproteus coralliicola]|uniref:DUF1269 domain-containing protein n=1 Tax=Motiliproteus coralliicola TaxID=2283196 RepID=A0A369WAF3_9GAMM|nr:hypothetical protein [Motiliproteus coralliicola]RDE18283.1 hypothetical protein DV711_16605 [Motiliproteus coralliicola]